MSDTRVSYEPVVGVDEEPSRPTLAILWALVVLGSGFFLIWNLTEGGIFWLLFVAQCISAFALYTVITRLRRSGGHGRRGLYGWYLAFLGMAVLFGLIFPFTLMSKPTESASPPKSQTAQRPTTAPTTAPTSAPLLQEPLTTRSPAPAEDEDEDEDDPTPTTAPKKTSEKPEPTPEPSPEPTAEPTGEPDPPVWVDPTREPSPTGTPPDNPATTPPITTPPPDDGSPVWNDPGDSDDPDDPDDSEDNPASSGGTGS